MVGCVLVRNGRTIGEGWHRRFGGPHAEIDALRRCHGSPRGATAYVTLEPCCYYGKTPPCTDALLAAGIRRVVAAVRDPNPRVAGRGLRVLRAAGVAVTLGVCAEQAAALNAPFFKFIRRHRPWVILKWAQSLDGKIATHTGDSKWISDEVCRAHAHRQRGLVDAIIVGIGTVLKDDPLLTSRVRATRSGTIRRPPRIATRIVLDSDLRIPPRAQLVRTAKQVPTWIFCGPSAPAARVRRLEAAGCHVTRVPLAQPADGQQRRARLWQPFTPFSPSHSDSASRRRAGLSLAAILDELGKAQMLNVLVEGGGRLLGAFMDERLADEVQVYIAPLLIGGAGAPGPLHGHGAARVARAHRLVETSGDRAAALRRLGAGWFLRTRV
jgi:diaminohydroxyphosphoribosylaminopyrimidine deaminase/5-amino-6-(5-phosphoribosylamino)uracil reductase